MTYEEKIDDIILHVFNLAPFTAFYGGVVTPV